MRARELGYVTELHFVHLDSADLAIKRIENRVKDGGHGIPENLVRQRYSKVLINLRKAIEIFNIVFVYDNTNDFVSIATFYNGEMVMKSDKSPEWFENFMNGED